MLLGGSVETWDLVSVVVACGLVGIVVSWPTVDGCLSVIIYCVGFIRSRLEL